MRAEHEFVYQQVVADEEIVLHRGRRNLECLNNERRTEKRKNYSDDERFEVLACRRFLECNFSHNYTRSRACRAAACSAAFFVKPTPRAIDAPSMKTSTVNNF